MSAARLQTEPVTDIVAELETAVGSGVYVVDDRLRVERIDQCSDATISEARFAVRLDDGFDLLDARQRYHPDLRIVVRTDAVADERVMLFEGYPQQHRVQLDGKPAARKDTCELGAVGVYARLAQDERSWVFGRRMRSAAILDGLAGDPVTYAGESTLVEALPAVFNANGKPNRSAEPLTVVGIDGIARRIHVFTGDGSSVATAWSLADALRYLLWFYASPGGPVVVADLLDATEPLVGARVDPRTPFNAASMCAQRLRQPADNLEVEATNLVEALALFAEAAGLHVSCLPENRNGVSRSRLDLWAAEDGVERSPALAWGGRYADGLRRYDPAAVSPADVFEDNTLSEVVIALDESGVVNAPLVVGDVRRWEATVELVPGWLPEVLLDNVAAPDRPAAKLEVLTPDLVEMLGDDAELVPWYRKYHRKGSEFENHREVGRLWVLNEDGAYDGATYNRNTPFDDYQPFDFATVIAAVAPGAWARRARPLQPAITASADGTHFGVYVQISYDGGGSWHPAVGAVTVLPDRAGLWLGLVNPTAMVAPGCDYHDMNMWFALIDQTFRMRVTAVFDDDARLTAGASADPRHTPTSFRRRQLVYKPAEYGFAQRRETTSVLAAVNPEDTSLEIDDTAAARVAAERLVKQSAAGRVEATLTVPWIERSIALGDRVSAVGRRGVCLNGVERALGSHPAGWAVWGKRLVFDDAGAATTLQLVRQAESR